MADAGNLAGVVLEADTVTDSRQAAWLESLPVVWATLTRMRAAGEIQQRLDDDILQEGYLAAGLALRRWTPERGPAAPLIAAYVRGRVLNHLNTQHNGGIGSGRQKVQMFHLPETAPLPGTNSDNLPPDSPADGLIYAEPPDGFDDPAVALEREALLKQVRFAVELMDAEDRDMLKALYGLDGEPVTLNEYATRQGWAIRTAGRLRVRALERLRRMLR